VLEHWTGVEDVVLTWGGVGAAAAFATLDRTEPLRDLQQHSRNPRPWLEAALAYLSREFTGAADVYAAIGSRPDEAYARLRAAEQLAADGRDAEAEEQRADALAFYRSVGAARYVVEAEGLLAASA